MGVKSEGVFDGQPCSVAELCALLSLVPGIGLKTLLKRYAGISSILSMVRAFDWTAVDYAGLLAQWRRDRALWQEHGIALLSYFDLDYPTLLKSIPDPPLVLFARGDIRLLNRDALAIVGTRTPSTQALLGAKRLAADCAQEGVVVVSGLAQGIDSGAHLGALSVGGATVAVLGAGLLAPLPRNQQGLFERICLEGCVVSELPVTYRAEKWTFVKRNRLISGLSLRGTVVVEGALRSGSLTTANYAWAQERDVYAMPGPALSVKSAGNHALLKKGAIFLEQAADLKDWPPRYACFPAKSSVVPSLTEQQRLVLEAMPEEAVDAGSVWQGVLKSGLTLGQVMGILVGLECRGLVKQCAGQKYLKK